MPSFLGFYEGSAKDLPSKFRRAVKSVLNQTHKDFELIIISDGCQETNKIVKTEFSKLLQTGIIKLIELPRHTPFTGSVRQTGINQSTGDALCNLDVDDEFMPNHLWNINIAFNPKTTDWCFFNLYRKLDNLKGVEEVLNATPDLDGLCTANVIFKRGLDVTWNGADGKMDNKIFNKQLIDKYPNKIKIYGCGYIIHHALISHVQSN